MNKNKALSIRNLEVKFQVRSRFLTAIRNISFELYDQEILALVGESGSGKSVVTKTFTGMLESNGWISDGSIIYSPNEEAINDPKSYFKKPIDLVNFQKQLMSNSSIRAIVKINNLEIKKLNKQIKDYNNLNAEKIKEQIEKNKTQIKILTDKIDFNSRNNASFKIDSLNEKNEILEEQLKIATDSSYREKLIGLVEKQIESLEIDNVKVKNLSIFEKQKLSKLIKVLQQSRTSNFIWKDEYLEKQNSDSEEELKKYKASSFTKEEFSQFYNSYFENKKHLKKIEKEIKELVETYLQSSKLDEEHFENILVDWNRIKNIGYINKMNAVKEIRKLRGKTISTIFQDPMTSLNPLLSVGFQISEVLIKQLGMSKKEAKKEAIELLRKVGITNPEKRYKDIPGRYSGGMRQRVVIAIALASRPKILVCDEPTTALDVTIQAQILKLIKDLKEEYKFSVVFITHDLGVVAQLADRIAVMYAGQIIEYGTTKEIFYDPKHPYTWALLSSLPQLGKKGEDLYSIKGTPPSLFGKLKGDQFALRSEYAMEVDFLYEPPMFKVTDTHYAKTWLLDKRAPKVEAPAAIKNLKNKIKE